MKITLCGSAQFLDYFEYWNEALTARGHIVYSLGFNRRMDAPTIKRVLELVHLTKIDNSDAIIVINGDVDYIGETTMQELIYACLRGKHIYITNEPRVARDPGIGIQYALDAKALLSPIECQSYQVFKDSHMDQGYQGQPVHPLSTSPAQQASTSADPQPLSRKYSSDLRPLPSLSRTRL